MHPPRDITTLFERAVSGSSPQNRIEDWLVRGQPLRTEEGESLNPTLITESDRDVHIVAIGKAAWTMAASIAPLCGDRLARSLVVCPVEHVRRPFPDSGGRVRVIGSEHPLPGAASEAATRDVIRLLQSIPPSSRLVVLLSGGTSAMLESPIAPLDMAHAAETARILLRSGLSIHDMNTVRRALSRVKAGQLLDHLHESVDQIDLIVSDVPGDDPGTIGSGPTTPGTRSPSAALEVLEKAGILNAVPPAVRHVLEQDARREQADPSAFATPRRDGHRQVILSSSHVMAELANRHAAALGCDTHPIPACWSGPCSDLADVMVQDALRTPWPDDQPDLRVYHGECTLDVKTDRPGGRNQHLALLAGSRLWERIAGTSSQTPSETPSESSHRRFVLLSAGSDGRDGFTDAAGAVVDADTFARARTLGLDPSTALREFDTHTFFKKAGGLVVTGPTGNNLMDLQLVIRLPRKGGDHVG